MSAKPYTLLEKFEQAIKHSQHPLNWELGHWYNRKVGRKLLVLAYRFWRRYLHKKPIKHGLT